MHDDVTSTVQGIIYNGAINIQLSESDISQLNSLPAEKAIATLRAIFDSERGGVAKSRAYHAILSVRDFDKIQFLMDAFDAASIDWQIAYCRTLAEFHDPRAVGKLSGVLLESTDADVRYAAAEALGKIGDSKAVSALQYAQQNDTGEDFEGFAIADAAREALLKIKNRHK